MIYQQCGGIPISPRKETMAVIQLVATYLVYQGSQDKPHLYGLNRGEHLYAKQLVMVNHLAMRKTDNRYAVCDPILPRAIYWSMASTRCL